MNRILPAYAALIIALGIGWASPSQALDCSVSAPAVLSISDTVGSFTLTFTNFVSGTVSSSQAITYTVQGNKMLAGTVNGAVTASLGTAFSGMSLECDVGTYTNLGDADHALLAESSSGFFAVGATSTALANKTPGSGSGDTCLDGTLGVTWRTVLQADLKSGSQNRTLTVTLKDGN